MDCSLPGSCVHGILQAKILEWIAMSSSKESSQPRDGTCVSYISCISRRFFTTSASWEAQVKVLVTQLCPSLWTLWTVTPQALLSMIFPRLEYWSG